MLLSATMPSDMLEVREPVRILVKKEGSDPSNDSRERGEWKW